MRAVNRSDHPTAPPPAAGFEPAPALAQLPGLGPRSTHMLAAANIHTLADLQALGAVRAFVRVRSAGLRPSLNLLWALEGVLTGLPWQLVAREHRTSLLLALEQASQSSTSNPSPTTKLPRP